MTKRAYILPTHDRYLIAMFVCVCVCTHSPEENAATVAMPTSPIVAIIRRIVESTDLRNNVSKMAAVADINTMNTAHSDVTVTQIAVRIADWWRPAVTEPRQSEIM